MRARGFILGGTAGRTTLNGEGLQHEDGHSLLLSSTVPNCVSYDPTFSYELAVIMQDGLRRMYREQEDVYYYITVMNENYAHPAMPAGVEQDIIKGMYLFKTGAHSAKKVRLIGAGTIFNEVIAATDYMRAVAEQIRAFVPSRYTVLGTDGFGRSDTREQLRSFFEVNRYWITVAALKSLADDGVIAYEEVAQAIAKYNLDVNKPAPWTV